MTRGRIFINYRRDDSRADAGRLYDRLASRFPGRVFRDVASLEPGVEWHEAIARVLSQTDACLVVIGKDWATIADANGHRRLDDPGDTVRREIVTALELKMRVIPVLVGGAKMPAEEQLPADVQALCRRNALEITEQDWDAAFARLLGALENSLGLHPVQPDSAARSARTKWVLAATACLAGLALVAGYSMYRRSAPPAVNHSPVDNAPNPPRTTASKEAVPNSEPPRRPALNARRFVGNWQAVVDSNGQTFNEQLEFYGDNSFRGIVRGALATVGKWHYNNAAESLEVTEAANFMNNAVKFHCDLRDSGGDRFGGRCVDRQRNSWEAAMTRRGGPLPEANADVPRVDLSELTLAERVAFVQELAAMRCTCTCGLSVLVCLQRDQTCKYSPNLAKTALTNFLRATRSS